MLKEDFGELELETPESATQVEPQIVAKKGQFAI